MIGFFLKPDPVSPTQSWNCNHKCKKRGITKINITTIPLLQYDLLFFVLSLSRLVSFSPLPPPSRPRCNGLCPIWQGFYLQLPFHPLHLFDPGLIIVMPCLSDRKRCCYDLTDVTLAVEDTSFKHSLPESIVTLAMYMYLNMDSRDSGSLLAVRYRTAV